MRITNIFYGIAFLISLIVVFLKNYFTTCDLLWPFDIDFWRNIALVQSTLEGHYFADPSYLGYSSWYPPLKGWIESAICMITDLPPHLVVTRAGVYLNLLAPLSLFGLILSLFRSMAIATWASMAFLFFNSLTAEPEWISANFSPWSFTVCFAQSFFYISLIFVIAAFRTNKRYFYLLAGSFTGITLLVHPAPAVLLIFIIGMLTVFRCWPKKDFVYGIKIFLLTCLPFLLFASPLLYQLYSAGNTETLNYDPSSYIYPDLPQFGDFIYGQLGSYLLISIAGFVLIRSKLKEAFTSRILYLWISGALLFFVYTSLLAPLRKHFSLFLPELVPSFHFVFYLKAVQTILFALGVVYMSEYFLSKINVLQRYVVYILPAILIPVMLWGIFSYINHPTLPMTRESTHDVEAEEVYFLLLKKPDTTVVLAGLYESMFPVMPSARKIVVSTSFFSNPAADYHERNNDRNRMFRYLESGTQKDSLSYLLNKYSVDMILLNKKTNPSANKSTYEEYGRLILENERYRLYQLQ